MAEVKLADTLDVRAAAPLKAALGEHRGQDVTLDASEVVRLGGLCLQVLLAAQAAWRADGRAFRIAGASPAFLEGARLMAASSLLTLEAA